MRTPTPKEDVMAVASSRRSGTPSRQFVARLMRAATLNVKEEQQWLWEHVVSKDWFASMFEDKANFSRQRLRTLVYASGMGYNANTQDALEAIQRRKERGFAGRGRRKMTPRLVQKDVNDIIGRSKGGLSPNPKPATPPVIPKQDNAAARSALTDQADKLYELALRFRSRGQGSPVDPSQFPPLPIFANTALAGSVPGAANNNDNEGEGEGEGEHDGDGGDGGDGRGGGGGNVSELAAAVAAATGGLLPNNTHPGNGEQLHEGEQPHDHAVPGGESGPHHNGVQLEHHHHHDHNHDEEEEGHIALDVDVDEVHDHNMEGGGDDDDGGGGVQQVEEVVGDGGGGGGGGDK